MSEAVVLWASIPLTPLMVRVLEPSGVEEAVQTCSVEDPAPVTVGGLKVAVAFAGNPVPSVKVTVWLKPLARASTLTV